MARKDRGADRTPVTVLILAFPRQVGTRVRRSRLRPGILATAIIATAGDNESGDGVNERLDVDVWRRHRCISAAGPERALPGGAQVSRSPSSSRDVDDAET